MAILVDDGTRLLVQGITGRGRRVPHSKDATERHQGGRRGDAGQGRAGLRRRPCLRHRREGRRRNGREREHNLRSPPFAADAIFESLDAGLTTICCITEGIPVHDMMRVANYLGTKDATLVGPNCPGVLSPEKANVSSVPKDIFMPWQRRRRKPHRHANLPDRQRAHAEGRSGRAPPSGSAATP